MKKLFNIAVIAIVLMVVGCSNKAKGEAEETAIKTTADSISMYMGSLYGAEFKNMVDSAVDRNEFVKGVEEGVNTPLDSLQKVGMSLMEKAEKAEGAEKNKLQSRMGGLSFAAQYVVGSVEGFKQQFKLELNKKIILKYFTEAFTSDKDIDTNAMEQAFNDIMKRYVPQQPQQQQADPKAAEANEKAGAEFIEKEMKADKSLKKTASGLVYKVIKEGKGAKPTMEQTARVKYEGRHINGEVFDNGNGEVQEFPLARVVAGFSEGLTLMSPGAKYRLYIPGNLAYGPNGAGGMIGPNETLVFDVELVGVK